jgi:hypothetical protein
MARKTYDKDGKLLTVQRTDSEAFAKQAISSAGIAAGILVIILVAPFFPILWVGWKAFELLTLNLGWHELFAGIIGLVLVVLGIFALWKFRWFRSIYLAAELIFVTWFAFNLVSEQSDLIWACFTALILIALGGYLIFKIDQQIELIKQHS